jgi:hypothetical protein
MTELICGLNTIKTLQVLNFFNLFDLKKYIYILILFYFAASCKVHEKKTLKGNGDYDFSDLTDSITDNTKTTNNNLPDHENKIKIEKSNLLVGATSGNYYHEDIRIIEVPNTKVFKQQNNLSEGRIVYKIPNVMRIRSTYKVFVRISKSKSTVSIYDSLSGEVMTSRIPVTETMEVRLVDVSPSDKKMFDIVTDGNQVQIVESGDTYTEWSWNVTPIHVGVSKLKIVVSIIKNNNKKDIVYEDTVEIERDVKEQIIFFWEEYWKWIITTFIMPFIVWWWKNRKKKKDDEEPENEHNEKT